MRPQLRAQLRRQKGRSKVGPDFRSWSNHIFGITVPLTRGQMALQRKIIRNALNDVMSKMIVSQGRPDTMVMSTDAYEAYKSTLMYQTVE